MDTYITSSDFRLWRASHGRVLRRRDPRADAAPNRSEEIRLAQLQFPNGQRIDDPNPSSADIAARTLIYTSDCTVFDSCLTSGPFVARPDILSRQGAELHLVRVATQGARQSEWQDVFEDLVFDLVVLETSCFGLEILPHVMVVLEATAVRSISEPQTAAPVSAVSVPCLFPMRSALDGFVKATVADMDKMFSEWVRSCAPSRRKGRGEKPR